MVVIITFSERHGHGTQRCFWARKALISGQTDTQTKVASISRWTNYRKLNLFYEQAEWFVVALISGVFNDICSAETGWCLKLKATRRIKINFPIFQPALFQVLTDSFRQSKPRRWVDRFSRFSSVEWKILVEKIYFTFVWVVRWVNATTLSFIVFCFSI